MYCTSGLAPLALVPNTLPSLDCPNPSLGVNPFTIMPKLVLLCEAVAAVAVVDADGSLRTLASLAEAEPGRTPIPRMTLDFRFFFAG